MTFSVTTLFVLGSSVCGSDFGLSKWLSSVFTRECLHARSAAFIAVDCAEFTVL